MGIKKVILFILILFGSYSTMAQVSIVPHYPETAFKIDRVLPFVVSDRNTRILSVNVEDGLGCSSLVDAEVKNRFYILCGSPSVISVEIEFQGQDQDRQTLRLSNAVIYRDQEPEPEPVPEDGAEGEPMDDEGGQ